MILATDSGCVEFHWNHYMKLSLEKFRQISSGAVGENTTKETDPYEHIAFTRQYVN